MGSELVGRYRLLRKLANGGMGEVFLGEALGEAGFRRPVVIKRLFPHLLRFEEAVQMFQNEAHVLAQLSHPNIPQVYDLGRSDGRWFVAIEYVPGHTLGQLVQRAAGAGMSLPLEVTLAAVIQLCEALHHAHERHDDRLRPLRIVHRDVNPTNVMVTPDGFAKLLDFGVAKQGIQETKGGALRGTLSYMAPEQVRSQRLDKRSDVFAVGVILYELTTGRRLFTGPEVEVMQAIVERDVTPPSQFVPHYPPDLERIILTALSRDRARRWPSAAHLERALEEYATRNGIVATHRVLARFYQGLFPGRQLSASESTRPQSLTPSGSSTRAKTPSSIAPQAPASVPPPASVPNDDPMADVRSLGAAGPANEGAGSDETPAPLSLPGSPPMALGTPKRRGRGPA